MPKQYSKGIVIHGSRIKDGNPSPLKAANAKKFIDAATNWLETIGRTNSGPQTFSEIGGSGHTVNIYRSWTINEGNYRAGGDGAKGLVVALDTAHPNGETELKRALDCASEDLSGRSNFKKVSHIGKVKPRFLKRGAVAQWATMTMTMTMATAMIGDSFISAG